MPARKPNKLSKGDQTFISRNYTKKSAEEIHVEIRKPLVLIQRFIEGLVERDKKAVTQSLQKNTVLDTLKKSPEWKGVKKEYTLEEIIYLEERYSKLMVQFESDEILATEEGQILMLIRYEILMRRNMRETKQCIQDAEDLEMESLKLEQKKQDNNGKLTKDETMRLRQIDNLQGGIRSRKSSLSTELTKLQERHSSLVKDLKGTRDQRLQTIQNSKVDFMSLIKRLQEDEDFRENEGEELLAAQIATQLEYNRLTKKHRYIDTQYDIPIYKSSTAKNLREVDE